MEQKLDGLVTLLAASQAKEQPSAAPNLQPFLTPNSLSPDNGLNDFGASQSPFVAVVPLEEKTQKCSCSESTIQEALSGDNVIGIIITGPKYQCDLGGRSCTVLDLNDEVAAALLDNYRASMSKYFPFVVIPTSINVQLLRTSKPFLYLSVMAVSSYQKTGQHATLSTEIMKRLSEQMLLRGEKTLDLLQGVLVCAEWFVL
jgi:hypothetical protein